MFVRPVLIVACVLTLAACGHNGAANFAATQPRGASVAFEQIDGPPPAQFQTLVRNLNDEAQARRLAVMSRESPSAYRVRGYLSATVAKGKKGPGQTTISWVWEVFDQDQNRAFRIEGEEEAKGTGKNAHDAWAAADDAMLGRIAQKSMEQLAAFLTSPNVAPATEPPLVQAAYTLDNSSPEAAGIFRIFRAHADPLPSKPAESAPAPDNVATDVPLPPQRPGVSASLSPTKNVELADSTL